MRLTLTEQGTADGYERLQKAGICVYDETAGTTGVFSYVGDDLWESDFSGQPEHTYRLEIEVEGCGIVSARTTMPAQPQIYAQNTMPSKKTLSPEEALPDNEIGVRFQTGSLPQGPVWIKRMTKGWQNTDDSYDDFHIANKIATSLTTVDSFNLTGDLYDSSILFDPNPVDPNPSPASEPVAWAHVYAYVTGQPYHDAFLRIPPVREIGERKSTDPDGFFSVSGEFSTDYDHLGRVIDRAGYLLFMSVSEEYDRYLKELLIEGAKLERTDGSFAALFDHENLYSNIDGGAGIFGSYSQARSYWNSIYPVKAPLHLLEK